MSSGFILSSFPVPPTHVPIRSPNYLSTTFLVGGGLDKATSDANAGGGGLGNANSSDVEIYAGIAQPHRPSSQAPSLVSLPLRSRSSSSASSLASSLRAPSLTFQASSSSPSSHQGIAIVSGSGPPPTLPLPPLPPTVQPQPLIAFAYSSSSSSGYYSSARSLKSATSSESLRSVGSMQSLRSQKTPQYQGTMTRRTGRLDSSQSMQSLVVGGSSNGRSSSAAPLLRNNRSDSDGSATGIGTGELSDGGGGIRPDAVAVAIGPSCTTPTQQTGRHAHTESSSSYSSFMEYEESILDVKLDFDDDAGSSDGGGDDGNRSLIDKGGGVGVGGIRISSHDQKNDSDRVTFPSSPNQAAPLPFTTASSSFNNTNSTASSSFTLTSADSNTNLNYYATNSSKLGSPATPGQTRNRSRSGTLTSVRSSKSSLKSWQGQHEKNLKSDSGNNYHNNKYNNNNTNNNTEPLLSSSSRIRTYSQPSSASSVAKPLHPHYHSQSHTIPPLSTRTRAVSSTHNNALPRIPLNNSSYQPVSSSTSKPQSVSNSSVTGFLQSRHIATAMSAPPSPPALIALPPPIDITRDHDPPPITPVSQTHKHLSSSPNPSSFGSHPFEADDDRSTSPDLQALLSHTSEVLKSNGKVRSSSRPGSRSRSRTRVKSDDRIRTNSTVSAGSKRSVGSGSVGSGKHTAAAGLPTPSRNQSRLHNNHTFGSSGQKSQSRLRSDSKTSLVSKSSTDRFTGHSGASVGSGSSSHTNATAGPSSRASLMDESFDDDDRDVFREDDGDTEKDREEDAFSFFNPGSSSRHYTQNGEDDPTLTISFPVMEDDDGEGIIDLKTPLPHLLLRAGVLSPHSKLLPREVGSSDEEDSSRRRGRVSPVDSLISSTTASSKHPRDSRDTAKRRVRHKDGKLLRGGIGLTTGLGWSDSEDEDAPSEFTTRLKRLASMGGLSALSRKTSMASNMSGYAGSFSTTTSNLSGYGSVYGGGNGSFGTNGHSYAPSISVSQSGSGGRLSTYTTYSSADTAPASKRGSMYSETSVNTGYSGRYVNGSGGTTTPSVSVSASSSRNVSRQSSLSSIPYHQSPLNSHHNPKDSEIIEEDEDFSIVTSSKDKERARKTASMVHVDEQAANQDNEKETLTTTSSSSIRARSPLRRERNSTISVSSTSSIHSVQSTESTQSNTLSLNPPSIAGSATPTPETPTTPTPMSSFSVHEPSPSHVNSSAPSSLVHPVSTRQPIRLNTSHLGIGARSHSPVPPPSPAPTGPLPPTPGDVLNKGKVGPTTVVGVPAFATPVTSKSSPTPGFNSSYDDPYSDTIPAATSSSSSQPPPFTSPHSNIQKTSGNPPASSSFYPTSQIPSPPPSTMSSSTTNPARVTSPTPSFSMPTGSRTIHPPRSRAGSLSSSRDSSFSVPGSVKSKPSEGSISSLTAIGGGEERERGRLPFVVEDDDGTERDDNNGSATNQSQSQSQALPSPIDPDAIAIVEMEPSEYGDGVAVALTGDEETSTSTTTETMPSQISTTRDESNIDTQSIPEYPYRFEMPPPSPVISAKGNSSSNTGSFGFRRPRPLQQGSASSTSSPSLSSGLAKYSVTSPPSVAFSPTPPASVSVSAFAPRQHEYNASVSSLETSESTISILGRSDHMRQESWNQNFSVFGSGMGVPPPDEPVQTKPATIASRLPSALAKPSISRNNTYHHPTTAAASVGNSIPPSSSSAPSAVSSLLSRAASPVLVRPRAASPISSISSMRVGSSLGFASSSSSSSSIPQSSSSSSTLNGTSIRRPTTPSSQLGLTSFSQRARGTSPVPPPPSTSNAANTASKLPSATPHQHAPITPAPRKSSLPLPPSFLTSPGRPTSPPPPPPAAGHMPSLLLRPTQGSTGIGGSGGGTGAGAGSGAGVGVGAGAGSVPRKVGGIPRPSPSPSPAPISTSTSIPSKAGIPTPTPSPLSTSSTTATTTTKIASSTSSTSTSIPSSLRSSSGTPHSMTMLPQPGSGKRVGTPLSRYGTPGIGSGIGKKV